MDQYDTLTGLPNKGLCDALLHNALSRAHRQGRMLALMLVNIDHYEAVCDIIGNEQCDDLIKQVAQRLRTHVRQEDIVARVGEDEFVILIEDVYDVSQVNASAQKLLALFYKPVELGGKAYNLGLSAGISLFPFTGDKAADLLARAADALYHAKEEGGNRFRFFTEELNRLSERRMALENALQTAQKDAEFFLSFEPIYDLHSNRLVAAETLLNWHSNELGLVPVEEFAPVATDMGLMSSIREWELKTACEAVAGWGKKGLRLFVKIGRAQFEDLNFTKQLRAHLSELQLQPSQLTLKIDESTIASFRNKHADKLRELCEMGFRLAVDHYGMGVSCLFQLKQLCIDAMRIDRRLIEKMDHDRDIEAVIISAIKLAHSLDYLAMAVGVLNEEHLIFLKQQGCDLAQGPHFSKVLDGEQFQALIESLE